MFNDLYCKTYEGPIKRTKWQKLWDILNRNDKQSYNDKVAPFTPKIF